MRSRTLYTLRRTLPGHAPEHYTLLVCKIFYVMQVTQILASARGYFTTPLMGQRACRTYKAKAL